MDGGNEQRVAMKFCFKAGTLRQKPKYWCKMLMGMRLFTDQKLLVCILDFEMEGS